MGAETPRGKERVNQPKSELSLLPTGYPDGGAKKSNQNLYRATGVIQVKERCPFLCFSLVLPFFLFE